MAESDEHKQAKAELHHLLEIGFDVRLQHCCSLCEVSVTTALLKPNIKHIVEEFSYRLPDKRTGCKLDIVGLDANKKPRFGLEIWHTSRTKNHSGRDAIPWYEVKATEVLAAVKQIEEDTKESMNISQCPYIVLRNYNTAIPCQDPCISKAPKEEVFCSWEYNLEQCKKLVPYPWPPVDGSIYGKVLENEKEEQIYQEWEKDDTDMIRKLDREKVVEAKAKGWTYVWMDKECNIVGCPPQKALNY